MTRKMEQIEVTTTGDGRISISQENPYNDVGSSIIISPDQVDVLCQWLKEEKDKIMKEEK